jgi:CPA2 family monovalent cation:H+ antiporter-2
VVDFVLNFPPGLVVGLLLGWGPLASLLLGGVTYISSSGVIAKVLAELKWQNNPETPTILSVLVLEDLAMAIYLPLAAVLLIGQGVVAGLISILVVLATVGVVLFVAVRYGKAMSRMVSHQSDEVTLLTTFGLVLLVAGVAQQLQVSAAVGAFLTGMVLSGLIVEQTQRLLGPLRDLFAAIFFLFFGLQIDPATLPPVLLLALGLGVVSALTKLLTGWWAARHAGVDVPGRWRAGAALVARGEFSIVIAGFGATAGLEAQLEPLAAAYVLFLAMLGPILARTVELLRATLTTRLRLTDLPKR